MLRRPPTTLQITPEDLASYEDRRAREAQQAAQDAHAARVAAYESAQAMEGVQSSPDPEVRVRRARDQRIGVSSRRTVGGTSAPAHAASSAGGR
ncbi:hypothetical protein S40285_09338 [Stachybotrys chlorohalonatus IBT 40285]|uniref:Anaphase-promoting complex subunit CDC26 n=1 Tax=Stachybotrys chlorohalonatus (strain IBT 40285) TaxID=1283841 RepID=A0A084Q9S3_STAC4|nr:hypothetical protein S40285_09338 [Stachybotrys chlorohalonata IBT 40285]